MLPGSTGTIFHNHSFLIIFIFIILRRMGKNTASAPTLPRIRFMYFDLTHAPVAATARAAATGPVSMSTRPDPEGSDTVEIRSHPEMSSSPGSVGLARAHPLTKT